MKGTFDNDGKANDNKKDGENGFPGDVVRKDVPSSEQKNNAGCEKAETGKFFFFGDKTDDAWDDDK